MITLNMYYQLQFYINNSHEQMTIVFLCPNNFFSSFSTERKGTVNGTQPYSSLPPEAVFANSLGVLIIVFGLVVLRILSNCNWERPEPGIQDAVYRVRASLQSSCISQLQFFWWGSLTGPFSSLWNWTCCQSPFSPSFLQPLLQEENEWRNRSRSPLSFAFTLRVIFFPRFRCKWICCIYSEQGLDM